MPARILFQLDDSSHGSTLSIGHMEGKDYAILAMSGDEQGQAVACNLTRTNIKRMIESLQALVESMPVQWCCYDCGHKFSKVKTEEPPDCPKCGGTDTSLVEEA